MSKFRGTYMTQEQYTNWLVDNIKINTKHFMTAHYAELKMYYSNIIAQNQEELVSLGFTWEQVEAIELDAMKTA